MPQGRFWAVLASLAHSGQTLEDMQRLSEGPEQDPTSFLSGSKRFTPFQETPAGLFQPHLLQAPLPRSRHKYY